MNMVFEFHHDGPEPPDVIEVRDPQPEVVAWLRQAEAGEIPVLDVLRFPYWINGQERGPGLFRAGRIRRVQTHWV